MLGSRVALPCGFVKPIQRHSLILRHPLAVRAHDPEVKLGERMALAGRFQIPQRGLLVIRRAAIEIGILHAQTELRLRITAVSSSRASSSRGSSDSASSKAWRAWGRRP